ncbi:MAG: DUF302 domain-containing protein [bacterium]
MKRHFIKLLLLIMLMSTNSFASSDLIMKRSNQDFPETMLNLQQAIKDQGYIISRVQRVDVGLTKMGYKTDKYRVVFLGKKDELHFLTNKYPELIPYLPLKISIFAENEETLMVTIDPSFFHSLYPQNELQPYFNRWSKDLKAILNKL